MRALVSLSPLMDYVSFYNYTPNLSVFSSTSCFIKRRKTELEGGRKSSALAVDVDSFMSALELKMDDVRAANFATFDEVEEKRAVAGNEVKEKFG